MESEVIAELKAAAKWYARRGRKENAAIISICNKAVEVITHQRAEIKRLQNERKEEKQNVKC